MAACDQAVVSARLPLMQQIGRKAGLAAVADTARRLTVLQDVSAAFPLSCLFFNTLTNCRTDRQLQEEMSQEPDEKCRTLHRAACLFTTKR